MHHKSKIFGIGLSRTGTTSLHHLFEQLGYKSKHFNPALFEPVDHSYIDSADVFVDSPIPLIYQELDMRYVGSKFIMTLRDKEKWLTSMKWMFEMGPALWDWDEQTHAYHEKLYRMRKFNQEILSQVWDQHLETARSYFADRPDDYLEIKIDEPFDKLELAEFLNLEPFEIDLPKSNIRRNPGRRRRLWYAVRSQLGLLNKTLK